MSDVEPNQPVTCHRCRHGYSEHRPACTVRTGTSLPCSCLGFRWVDVNSTPDVYGYHRRS